MEKKIIYRVRAITDSTWDDKPFLNYVVQKRILGFLWITISEETKDKKYAEEMCENLNKTNT
jgi:hypothetical protein